MSSISLTRAALYFVASPLQYLAALRIAETHEAGSRQILVWYKPGVATVVKREKWDAASYMHWPRLEPLPGAFGCLRRLRSNLLEVAVLVGQVDELIIHSAVFDTEAINYFLRALPRLCGAASMHARILPDGIISIRRYPLSVTKRAAQCLRKLRRLAAPELNYWCFSGDRIGSDATFCDRIYVLPGLPHEYPAEKVIELPPLVTTATKNVASHSRALVIGQPLAGAGLMSSADSAATTAAIFNLLTDAKITEVFYKGHPKDPQRELDHPSYRNLDTSDPLEIHLGETAYDYVISVRSSGLLFAAQLRRPGTRVIAINLDKVRFKNPTERLQMIEVFDQLGIERL